MLSGVNIPKILKDFIECHSAFWKGRRVFIIATMGLFSGDGAGILSRLLEKYGAVTVGGLHLKMPDSIGDEKALKRSIEKNRALVLAAKQKIIKSAHQLKAGSPTKEGLGNWCFLAGLFGQRLYFYNATKKYSDRLKIDAKRCRGCGKCAKLCPMNNLTMVNGIASADSKCTMCYRCVNECPGQAITLLGRKVIAQSRIEKYINGD